MRLVAISKFVGSEFVSVVVKEQFHQLKELREKSGVQAVLVEHA